MRDRGTWTLVLQQPNGAFLSKAGADIVERVGAPRRTDRHCSPSAWKTRTWHWDGTRLVPTAWRVTAATLHSYIVLSHRAVGCAFNEGPPRISSGASRTRAAGQSTTRAWKPNGKVTLCDAPPAELCAQNAVTDAPVLRIGQSDEDPRLPLHRRTARADVRRARGSAARQGLRAHGDRRPPRRLTGALRAGGAVLGSRLANERRARVPLTSSRRSSTSSSTRTPRSSSSAPASCSPRGRSGTRRSSTSLQRHAGRHAPALERGGRRREVRESEQQGQRHDLRRRAATSRLRARHELARPRASGRRARDRSPTH